MSEGIIVRDLCSPHLDIKKIRIVALHGEKWFRLFAVTHRVEIPFWVVTTKRFDQYALKIEMSSCKPTGSFQNYLLLKREFLRGVTANSLLQVIIKNVHVCVRSLQSDDVQIKLDNCCHAVGLWVI